MTTIETNKTQWAENLTTQAREVASGKQLTTLNFILGVGRLPPRVRLSIGYKTNEKKKRSTPNKLTNTKPGTASSAIRGPRSFNYTIFKKFRPSPDRFSERTTADLNIPSARPFLPSPLRHFPPSHQPTPWSCWMLGVSGVKIIKQNKKVCK